MAYSHGRFTFDGQADGDAAEFDWTDQSGTTTTLANSNTAGRWCHDTDSTSSSNVGPDHGQGGDPDGYAYTEMTSQVSGDVWYCEFGTSIDTTDVSLEIDFYWCARGNSVRAVIDVQTQEGTSGWVTQFTTGYGDETIPGTSGATTWFNKVYDITNDGADPPSHATTTIRIRITCTADPTSEMWHNDIGLDGILISGDDLATQPTITNAGDELFETNETNITVTGTAFGSPQGGGDLELGNSSVYASATKVSQSIDSWADTSIQFDMTIGALTEIDLWLFATNDDALTSVGYPVQVYRTPTITNIEDEIFNAGETGIVLDGTYFQDTQSTGKVELADGSTYATATKVAQTIVTWSDDEIVFDLALGSFDENDTLYIFVTNSLGRTSTGTAVTVTGWPISDGLWKTSSFQQSITSAGLTTTAFLIRDE